MTVKIDRFREADDNPITGEEYDHALEGFIIRGEMVELLLDLHYDLTNFVLEAKLSPATYSPTTGLYTVSTTGQIDLTCKKDTSDLSQFSIIFPETIDAAGTGKTYFLVELKYQDGPDATATFKDKVKLVMVEYSDTTTTLV